MENNIKEKVVKPSEFMRELRPEYYSDTTQKTSYVLDKPTFEYHLDSITARNQTHEFEIFCRKLCERAICPNLRPATGPEGGGDSKVDTETFSVSDETANLTYVGHPNAGRERWAFAFSAKKTWADKVRKDVAGIVGTKRDYKKIICVTSRFARGKTRSDLEDELSAQYGIEITIHDRNWIVEEILDKDRKDLAYNYLGVGQEINNAIRLGPTDYSRTQQLEDIEKAFDDPEAFAGMEMQRVTEALVAAKLSRNLERPRHETEGRFLRAIRLANQDGIYRQKISALYESIWTAFWWFDDIAYLNVNYDEFEKQVIDSPHAKNLELLCNLSQLLFNCVFHNHLSIDEANLYQRVERLVDRLTVLIAEDERPNNALEAQTSLLVLKLNLALLQEKHDEVSLIWPQFSEVVKKAEYLGEYDVEKLIELIEAFGQAAGNSLTYSTLVDDVADLVSHRTGEAQGALILLKRAQQLDFDSNFEIIRLLGKAVRQLSKKEYSDSLIEALQLLALAYRSAGLLWASRTCCYFSVASIFIDAEEDSDLSPAIVPHLLLLGWVTLELRHLPDIVETVILLRGCAASLPLDEASKERLNKQLVEFDIVLASYILNFDSEELKTASSLPDIFESLEFFVSRNALLYSLGHENVLRSDGSIPTEETSEGVTQLFTSLANQPSALELPRLPIFNEPGTPQYLSTKVQGMLVEVEHQTTDTSILVAEVILGAIEALFATMLELRVAAHTEKFTVSIIESPNIKQPDYKINLDDMIAVVEWPENSTPNLFKQQTEIIRFLINLVSEIFTSTCFLPNLGDALDGFFQNDSLMERIAMIVVSSTSRERVFKNSISRLQDWNSRNPTKYELLPIHPKLERIELNYRDDRKLQGSEIRSEKFEPPKDHRDLQVRSVIDIPIWDRAKWLGVGFVCFPSQPPVIGLAFENEEAARKIFSKWQDRFGKNDKKEEIYFSIVRRISDKNPTHYRVLITSGSTDEPSPSGRFIMLSNRMKTMEPKTEENLMHFIAAFQQFNAYYLMPAVLSEDNSIKYMKELSILKRKISIKTVSEIQKNEIEVMALDRETYIKKFGEELDESGT